MKIFEAVSVLGLAMLVAAPAAAGTIMTADGNITVTDVVTPIGPSLYQYDYTVADATGLLAVLDIDVSPGVSITGFSVPGGSGAFSTAYDSVLGLVSFIENNAVFTSTPESDFIFDSPVAPAATSFGVTLFDGTVGNQSGITGPIAAASAPEPSSLALCLLGMGGAALLFRRKRLAASRSL